MTAIITLVLSGINVLKSAWETTLGRYIIIGAAALFALWSYGAYQKYQGRAEVKAEWRASVERARAAIKADDAAAAALSKQTDDDLSAALAAELSKRQGVYDALRKAVDDAGCIVSDADARGLQPR